jgi:hypothetical protein
MLPTTMPRTILTQLPLPAIGEQVRDLAAQSSGQGVVRPFYGASTGTAMGCQVKA